MAKKLSGFEQAFAQARSRRERDFTYEGKKYHTRRADETREKWEATMRRSGPTVKPYRTIELEVEELPAPTYRKSRK